MLKKSLRKQNGFTLVELLIAMTIAAALFAGVIYFFRNSTVISTRISNETSATNELKNAFNSFDRDVQQAATVSTTNSNFPLILTWVEQKPNQTNIIKVIYNISANGTLQRNYTDLNGSNTMNVANNVNSAQTNCIWDSTNYNLTINMAVAISKISESRQFIIKPRVVRSSSLLPDNVTLTSSIENTIYGQLVTFAATVTPTTGSDIIGSGTVTFVVNGTSVYVSPVFNGAATYPVTNLPTGNYPVIALYSGDAVYMASKSNEVSQTVNQGTPTLSVTNSPVTYSGSPQPATVIGSVAGTVSNIKYGGSATVPINPGTYAITADFAPTDNTNYINLTGASAGNFIINKGSTTVTVTSSIPYSTPGQSVTFTATVVPGAATGSVTFKDGSNTLTPGGVVTLVSGSATYTTASLAVGVHSITAVYGGDTNYAGSTSAVLTQTVTNATANFSPSSGMVGTVITVTGSGWVGSDTISSVTFNGTTATKALSVNSSGSLSGTITVPTLTPGLKDITITGTKTGTKTFAGVFTVTTGPTLTNIGQNSSTSSGRTLTVTVPAGGVPVGSTIIVAFAMDSSSTSVSVTDTGNNSYSRDANEDNSGNVRTLIFSARVTVALTPGNTITVSTNSSITAKAVSAYYVSGLASSSRVDRIQSDHNNDNNPDSGNTSTTSQANELLIGAIGTESYSTTFTAGSGYTALNSAVADYGSGSSTTRNNNSITIFPEYRIVSTTSRYSADGTLSTSRDWAAAIVTYRIQ